MPTLIGLTKKDLDKLKAPKGQIVSDSDGNFFFIPQKDLKRLTIKRPHRKAVGKVWGAGPAQPQKWGCRRLLHWLLTHDPNTGLWHQASLAWIENC